MQAIILVNYGIMKSIFYKRRFIGIPKYFFSIGFIFCHQCFCGSLMIKKITTQPVVCCFYNTCIWLCRQFFQQRFLQCIAKLPPVAKPKYWQCNNWCRQVASVGNFYLNTNIFRIIFSIFYTNIKIIILIKNTRIH